MGELESRNIHLHSVLFLPRSALKLGNREGFFLISLHRCSGIHRGMGTHISRVKSVDLDSWTDEQLQSMLRWGNSRSNKLVVYVRLGG